MNTSAAVFILARSSEDWIPTPRTPEPMAAALKARPTNQDPDSHAAAELIPCPTCNGRARLKGQQPCYACPSQTKPGKDRAPGWAALRKTREAHSCRPCPSCEGSGWRERQEGEPPVDPYTLDRLHAEGADPRPLHEQIRDSRIPELWELEASLRKTERLLALAEGRVDLEQFGWERLKNLYWRAGDYALLERAHTRLAGERPMAWSTWRRFVVGRPEHDVQSDRIRERLDETANLLGAWMIRWKREQPGGGTATELRVPPWLHPAAEAQARKPSLWRGRSDRHAGARGERDTLIRAMVPEVGVAETARRFALTARRVEQILQEGGGVVASGPAA